jgi:hypothetical protein
MAAASKDRGNDSADRLASSGAGQRRHTKSTGHVRERVVGAGSGLAGQRTQRRGSSAGGGGRSGSGGRDRQSARLGRREAGRGQARASTAQTEEQQRRLVHPRPEKKKASSDALQRQRSRRRAAGEQAGWTRRLTCVRIRTGAATNNTETKSEQETAQTTGMSRCMSLVPTSAVCSLLCAVRSLLQARVCCSAWCAVAPCLTLHGCASDGARHGVCLCRCLGLKVRSTNCSSLQRSSRAKQRESQGRPTEQSSRRTESRARRQRREEKGTTHGPQHRQQRCALRSCRQIGCAAARPASDTVALSPCASAQSAAQPVRRPHATTQLARRAK